MKSPTSGFRVRPRFEQNVDYPPDAARDRIVAAVAKETDAFEIRSLPEFLVIHIAEKDRHRWSPRLQLSFEPAGAESAQIVGVYGPEHEVWAMFIFGYIATGLLGMFSGIYGFAQLYLGQEPWALWITGSMLVVAGFLYLGAQFGQKLGAWQTFQLHHAYQTAWGLPADETGSGSHI